jgi:hypothetical protein
LNIVDGKKFDQTIYPFPPCIEKRNVPLPLFNKSFVASLKYSTCKNKKAIQNEID